MSSFHTRQIIDVQSLQNPNFNFALVMFAHQLFSPCGEKCTAVELIVFTKNKKKIIGRNKNNM